MGLGRAAACSQSGPAAEGGGAARLGSESAAGARSSASSVPSGEPTRVEEVVVTFEGDRAVVDELAGAGAAGGVEAATVDGARTVVDECAGGAGGRVVVTVDVLCAVVDCCGSLVSAVQACKATTTKTKAVHRTRSPGFDLSIIHLPSIP